MNFGSVCSGIEAASAAWKPLGWHCAFLSEIAPFPRAVLAYRYPDVPLHGDFRTIQADEYAPIDVLVGGTPCQSFSLAGLRRGMADARGYLALEYLRLADRLHPRWVLWENVPGVLSNNGGRDFGAFLGGLAKLGYGFAYRVLDAQFFHLAQQRERVFVVGCAGDWRHAAEVLFEPASLRGGSAPRRDAGTDAPCGTLCGTSPGGGWRFDAAAGQLIPDVAHTLRVDVTHGRTRLETCAMVGGGVRRLTPREAERLQGFPDDYTLIPWRNGLAADSPRYKALGNSMAVPVMAWLGRRLAVVEAT